MDFWNLTLVEAASKLRRGEMRTVEYIEALLRRCERHFPGVEPVRLNTEWLNRKFGSFEIH